MGKIVEKARQCNPFEPIREGSEMVKAVHFNVLFKLIESEFQKLSELVAKTLGEQDVRIDEDIESGFEAQAERIEALENIHPGQLTAEILEKARVSTDKDGKPDGGLEKGDVILGHGGSIIRFGIFHHHDDGKIWGYWGELDDSLTIKVDKILAYWLRSEVTFLFRPKHES